MRYTYKGLRYEILDNKLNITVCTTTDGGKRARENAALICNLLNKYNQTVK